MISCNRCHDLLFFLLFRLQLILGAIGFPYASYCFVVCVRSCLLCFCRSVPVFFLPCCHYSSCYCCSCYDSSDLHVFRLPHLIMSHLLSVVLMFLICCCWLVLSLLIVFVFMFCSPLFPRHVILFVSLFLYILFRFIVIIYVPCPASFLRICLRSPSLLLSIMFLCFHVHLCMFSFLA